MKIEPPLAVGNDPGLPPHAIDPHPDRPVDLCIVAACWGHPINTLTNPAATLARTPMDTVAGISFRNVAAFIAMQPRALPGTIVLTGLGKPASDES